MKIEDNNKGYIKSCREDVLKVLKSIKKGSIWAIQEEGRSMFEEGKIEGRLSVPRRNYSSIRGYTDSGWQWFQWRDRTVRHLTYWVKQGRATVKFDGRFKIFHFVK